MSKATIGGKRLGSGNKMEVDLHNYGRSNHNLTRSFKSSLAPGVLYPYFVEVGLNGDVFNIDLDTFVRTLPTKGPLFGSFKMQVDLFKIPIRLYQAILHNNPLNIGLKMAEVKLPTLTIATSARRSLRYGNSQTYTPTTPHGYFDESCLMKYLGVSGLGLHNTAAKYETMIQRRFNAVPVLGYYDIFKCYYANKQEENAYVITANYGEGTPVINNMVYKFYTTGTEQELELDTYQSLRGGYYPQDGLASIFVTIKGSNLTPDNIVLYFSKPNDHGHSRSASLSLWQENNILEIKESTNEQITIFIKQLPQDEQTSEWFNEMKVMYTNNSELVRYEPKLEAFPLEVLDEARYELLSQHQLGETFDISAFEVLPFSTLFGKTETDITYNQFPLNGLVVKTYQSDMFNNWIQTDWIDGDNGISAITAVDVSDGVLTMDALNLQQKVYNLLNRIAVSGGTYQDWQEAVFTDKVRRHVETPEYCGGMSTEIVFEEVIQTSETSVNGEDKALGELGGRGKQSGKKGGHVRIEIDEPSFIMGIVSLTPRIDYSQGNKWYMTELWSIDDLHKPALDGIGFQDLLVERMAWFGARIDEQGQQRYRPAAGKQPAWLNYMTAVDEVYGDFAKPDGASFMVLNRNYEVPTEETLANGIADLTTYIDPAKFNYAFAYTKLESQNFWVQIVSKVKARRVMSAKIIPNL